MLVSALAATPMTPNAAFVAPYARPRAMWSSATAPMSAATGLGFGSPFALACVTSATDHKFQGTEITAKDHAARRLPEKTST